MTTTYPSVYDAYPNEMTAGQLTVLFEAGDCRELIDNIHGIQRMIMSQAAARAYPERYRLLGKTVREEQG